MIFSVPIFLDSPSMGVTTDNDILVVTSATGEVKKRTVGDMAFETKSNYLNISSSQNQNLVFAAPSASNNVPGFRSLVLNDLPGTTVGKNFLNLTNPSAITFPRINADNTVTALDAGTFLTAIGATTSFIQNQAIGAQTTSYFWISGTGKANQLQSTIVTGTAPLIVASTTVVTNLNADLLDGYHSGSFLQGNQTITLSQDVTGSGTTAITTTVARIQNVAVDSSAPTVGDFLAYDTSVSASWKHRALVASDIPNLDWSKITTGIPDSFTPSSHTHGNITNLGYIGTTANLPIITGTGGIVQVGAFGSTANTFAQGNDNRFGVSANALTFSTGGTGNTDSYNGSAAKTISYNSIGAAPASLSTNYIQNLATGTQAGARISIEKEGAFGEGIYIGSVVTPPAIKIWDVNGNFDAGMRFQYVLGGVLADGLTIGRTGAATFSSTVAATQFNASERISSPVIKFNNPSNILRWQFGMVNTETGSGVGSDLNLYRWWDDGSYAGTALSINRANGKASFGSDVAATQFNATGTINTNASYQINGSLFANTYKGANSGGYNVWIGGGGQLSIGEVGANYKGSYNTSNGYNSLYSNTTGYYNTANGMYSLYSNTTGYYNTANGVSSLYSNTTGSLNVAMGQESGNLLSNGAGNINSNNSIFLGYNTKALADNGSNEIVIGSTAIGNGSNSVTLGNDDITKTVLKGNVGIGTTTPAYKLDVSNGTYNFGITPSQYNTTLTTNNNNSTGTIILTTGTLNAVSQFQVKGNGSGYGQFQIFDNNSTNNMTFNMQSGNAYLYTSNGGNLNLQTSNGGNVGIGVNNPSMRLKVDGFAEFGNVGFDFGTGQVKLGTSIADYGGVIFLTNDLGANQGAVRLRSSHSSVGTVGKPNFAIDRSTTNQIFGADPSLLTYVNSLTIDGNNGNVGIGTTTPVSLLSVVVPIAKTTVANNVVSFLSTNDASNPFGLRTMISGAATLANRYVALQTTDWVLSDGGNIVLQAGGGNVSIGTISTPTKLTVYDNANTFNSFFYGNGSTVGVALGSASGSGLIQGINSAFNTYQNLSLNLSGGNVGIGYSTGTEITNNKLAVNGSGYFNTTLRSQDITIKNRGTAYNNGGVHITSWNTSDVWDITGIGSSGLFIGYNNADRLLIDATTGNLTSTGTLTAKTSLTLNGSTSGSAVISVNSDGSILDINKAVTATSFNSITGMLATGGSNGSAATVSRSDHNHSGVYATTNTTYDISAVTTTGGALLRLHGSDSTNDDVKFASGTNTTVAYTDVNTITINSTLSNVTNNAQIYSFNGLTAQVQLLGTIGTTGTAPAWSSTTATHTLNIPMASGAGVTAGLLSKGDYDIFNGKVSYTDALARACTITPLTLTNSAVVVNDSLVVSIGKLQAQVNNKQTSGNYALTSTTVSGVAWDWTNRGTFYVYVNAGSSYYSVSPGFGDLVTSYWADLNAAYVYKSGDTMTGQLNGTSAVFSGSGTFGNTLTIGNATARIVSNSSDNDLLIDAKQSTSGKIIFNYSGGSGGVQFRNGSAGLVASISGAGAATFSSSVTANYVIVNSVRGDAEIAFTTISGSGYQNIRVDCITAQNEIKGFHGTFTTTGSPESIRLSNDPTLYYTLGRNGTTGFLDIIGNQSGYTGINVNGEGRFSSTVTATRFIGGLDAFDIRSVDRLPSWFPTHSIMPFFNDSTPGSNSAYQSGINVQGWDNGMNSWQLIGSGYLAGNEWYFREGIGTWGGVKRIWHSGNSNLSSVDWATAHLNANGKGMFQGYTASGDFGADNIIGLGIGMPNTSKGINIGYNNVADHGFIGVVHNGTAWKNLMLCPMGGAVLTGGEIFINGNINITGAAGITRYIITDEGAAGTGVVVVQAGYGSGGAGGSIVLYSHSHGTHPGDVVAGLSFGSAGKFRVASQALDSPGTTVFSVSNAGKLSMANEVWHTSNEGAERIYFAGYSNTYFKSYTNTVFRTNNTDGIDKMVLDTAGNLSTVGAGTFAGGGFNSLRSKKDITTDNRGWLGDALSIINSTVIHEGRYKGQDDLTLFPVFEDELVHTYDEHLINHAKTAINSYSMMSLSWLAIQNMSPRIETLEQKCERLEARVKVLEGGLN